LLAKQVRHGLPHASLQQTLSMGAQNPDVQEFAGVELMVFEAHVVPVAILDVHTPPVAQ
jgi:hypothetical protein